MSSDSMPKSTGPSSSKDGEGRPLFCRQSFTLAVFSSMRAASWVILVEAISAVCSCTCGELVMGGMKDTVEKIYARQGHIESRDLSKSLLTGKSGIEYPCLEILVHSLVTRI